MEDNVNYSFSTPPGGHTKITIEYVPFDSSTPALPKLQYLFPPGATMAVKGGDTDQGDSYASSISIDGIGQYLVDDE